MKKRFTEEPIIGFLREAEAGMSIAELCGKYGFSEASYYLWRSKFGGMNCSDQKYWPRGRLHKLWTLKCPATENGVTSYSSCQKIPVPLLHR